MDHSLFDEIQQTTYYNSLIIKDNNPYKVEIKEAFDDLIGGFEEEK
jgi:hypothetical protein